MVGVFTLTISSLIAIMAKNYSILKRKLSMSQAKHEPLNSFSISWLLSSSPQLARVGTPPILPMLLVGLHCLYSQRPGVNCLIKRTQNLHLELVMDLLSYLFEPLVTVHELNHDYFHLSRLLLKWGHHVLRVACFPFFCCFWVSMVLEILASFELLPTISSYLRW